jgi:CRP-like cAMP-binding protein
VKNSLYILGQLTDEDVEWMLATGSRRPLAPGTILIREGHPADALYIVLDGTLSVTLAALGGREVDQPGVGTIIGEMSFVDAHPPSATVSARAPAVVFAIDRGRLQAKLDQDPAFAARFYRALAILLSDRLRNALAQLDGGQQRGSGGDGLDEDEIDLNVLDNVHLAGARFTRILQRLMGA